MAGLAVGLAPAALAWWLAGRAGIAGRIRRAFAVTCLGLSYGALALVGLVPGWPLSMVATFAAPVMAGAGHGTLATAIAIADGVVVNWLAIGAGVVAAIVLPLRLRRCWPGAWAALGS